jgi:uncharacterized protein
MKFLLFLIAVFVLLWMLRGSWRRGRRPPTEPTGPASPQAMLSCAQCGLHLPRDEALPGRGGVFCSAPHRAAYEQDHPAP